MCNECRENVADLNCTQCKLNLCKVCFSIIHKPKCLNHHVGIPIAQAMLLQNAHVVELPNCTVHNTRDCPLEFYCVDCKFEVCRNCVLTVHQGHKIAEVGEVVSNSNI